MFGAQAHHPLPVPVMAPNTSTTKRYNKQHARTATPTMKLKVFQQTPSTTPSSEPCRLTRLLSTAAPAGSESVPLTVQDTLVGLLAASSQARLDVDELQSATRCQSAHLRRLAGELKAFTATAHRLCQQQQLSQGEVHARAALVDLDVLIAILTASVLTVSELETRLDNMTAEASQEGLSMDEMCRRHAGSLTKDANRISMVGFIMGKLLDILIVTSHDEALRHRRLIHFATTDMLQADTTLVLRLTHLQDTHDAIPPRQSPPPPSYSAPSPSCDPPSYDDARHTRILLQHWSVYTGLSLRDIPALHRITIPLIRGELRDSYFYTSEYALLVREDLACADRTRLPEVLRLQERTDPTPTGLARLAQRFVKRS